nr:ABC-2 family transporter protein [Streptomyces atratus]
MSVLTFRLAAMSVKASAANRVDFLSRIAIGAVTQVAVVVFATVLITRFPGMGGWAQGDVLLIVAIRMSGHALAVGFFVGLRLVARLARTGNIDALLLRPLPVYRQVLLAFFHVPVIGDLIVAAVLTATALAHLTVDWTPWRVGYLACAIVGAMLLEAAVQTFLGGFAIRSSGAKLWQEWVEELMATFGSYPLHILPDVARAAFTFLLPVAFAAYLPAAVITGHTTGLPVPGWAAAAAPGVGLLLFLAARQWWNRQLARYESAGG